MNLRKYQRIAVFIFTLAGPVMTPAQGQDIENAIVTIDPETTYQVMEGFGAALAYYEGWLTAHPNKSEIYDAIFGELSLDILRVRNAHGYDAEMVSRVAEFAQAAEQSLGHPIPIMSTSWGPPAYLKSNNDRNNGGTLRYTIEDGTVIFDYAGFAEWWDESLDAYEAVGVQPAYISIQNEPDFTATYESCRLEPREKIIPGGDTIAGYNRALKAVRDTVLKREDPPKFLGPETIGIGYSAVQRFVDGLNTAHIDAIAHHLYHGVDEWDPYSSDKFTEVGNYEPEIPHWMSEFNRGDWYSLAGLIYKSLHDENVVAYLFWDLIWTEGGLVSLEFPWNSSGWTTAGGYFRTPEFYAFKQYSAFIHPGWIRVDAGLTGSFGRGVAFMDPAGDSLTLVVVNTSEVDYITIDVDVDGYNIDTSFIYKTSDTEMCEFTGALNQSTFFLNPRTIATVKMGISKSVDSQNDLLAGGELEHRVYPNPASDHATIEFYQERTDATTITLYDLQGKEVRKATPGILASGKNAHTIDISGLGEGLYLYSVNTGGRRVMNGKFLIR